MTEYKILQSEKDEIIKILQDIQNGKNISNGSARINQILSNAQIIQNGQSIVATQKPETAVAAAPKPETIVEKEKLTTNIIESLFGPYQNLRVYNNEEDRLIAMHYNDITPLWTTGFTKTSRRLKERFEEKFPQFELVAQVTMQVPEEFFPGIQRWSSARSVAKFSAAGTCIVGNLVIRDRRTGKLERFNDTCWFGVDRSDTSSAAARSGAYSLPFSVISLSTNCIDDLFAGRNVR